MLPRTRADAAGTAGGDRGRVQFIYVNWQDTGVTDAGPGSSAAGSGVK